MWVYHYRIWDHFPQQVISLAVLADDQKEWHPDAYRWGLGGCSLEFRFPVFKVMDCPDPEEEFERTGNLFAPGGGGTPSCVGDAGKSGAAPARCPPITFSPL